MLDRDLDKVHGVRVGAHAVNVDLVARHVLAHLLEDRDHIHSRAARQPHQQQLHRPETLILPAVRHAHILDQRMARPARHIEAHTARVDRVRRHLFRRHRPLLTTRRAHRRVIRRRGDTPRPHVHSIRRTLNRRAYSTRPPAELRAPRLAPAACRSRPRTRGTIHPRRPISCGNERSLPMKDGVVLLDDNAIEVLSYWDLRAGAWQTVGFVAGSLDGVSRPIIQIGDARHVLRRQSPDLTENDTLFRHAFMRHLTSGGLPIPPLLPRPDGHTYAVVEDGIYELQGWRDGGHYVTGDAEEDDELESAARTLGRLHQASADFEWQPHIWSAERSAAALVQAYCTLIRERSGAAGLPESVAAGLARVADTCDERLDTAIEALEAGTRPPELHIHGDYQPHNLGFSGGEVSAIYDFDAARWERRLDELAYALLY